MTSIRLNISRAIFAFGLVTILGLAAAFTTSILALDELKVGGPLYTKIKLGNDLVADILPPPAYIVESYLETTLALNDPSSLDARRERLGALKKEYEDRFEFWTKSDLSETLKSKLLGPSHREVQKLWKLVESDFIPALAKGDTAAAQKAYRNLSAAYFAHRGVIDEVVELTTAMNKQTENLATKETDSFTLVLWVVSIGVFLVIVAGLLAVGFGIAAPLAKLTGVVTSVADGNLNIDVPVMKRSDEIGALAKALATFKEKLIAQREQDRQIAEQRDASQREAAKLLLEMCESLEADVDSAVVEVLEHSQEAVKSGEQALQDARAISHEALVVAAAAEQAGQNVTSISAASEELSATGREIARRAVQSSADSHRAVAQVEEAGVTIAALKSSAEQIGSVLHLISEVASQTNLLALNATIEAARAGDAGRGFAVVANEVKALASKTSAATADIAKRVKQITETTGDSVEVLSKIGEAVRQINEVSAGMAAAAEEQEATLQEVARSLSEASAGVNSVAASVAGISARTERVEAQSRAVSSVVTRTDQRVSNLRANLIVSLRLSAAGDRRGNENRIPVKLSAKVAWRGTQFSGEIVDISSGGALFRAEQAVNPIAERDAINIEIQGIGRLAASVIAKSPAGTHVQFQNVGEDAKTRLNDFIRSVGESDRKFIDAATRTASQISTAFEGAIAQGRISRDALFDTAYQRVANTNPVQYLTQYVGLCDDLLPAIQEPVLSLDSRVAFCAAVDRNGFLPTHNAKFSNPQRPDDPNWNAANSRQRRIFNDRAGLSAGRTSREYLLQTYDREMGDGNTVTLKEVDVPIHVSGRHWGAVRLAYRA